MIPLTQTGWIKKKTPRKSIDNIPNVVTVKKGSRNNKENNESDDDFITSCRKKQRRSKKHPLENLQPDPVVKSNVTSGDDEIQSHTTQRNTYCYTRLLPRNRMNINNREYPEPGDIVKSEAKLLSHPAVNQGVLHPHHLMYGCVVAYVYPNEELDEQEEHCLVEWMNTEVTIGNDINATLGYIELFQHILVFFKF